MSISYNNREYIASFLTAFNPDLAVFQTFKHGGGNPELTDNIASSIATIPWERLESLNDKGAGIFFMPNRTKDENRKSEDVTYITCFFVDMDGGKEADPEGLAKMPEPAYIVQSKNGKHYYWIFDEAHEVTPDSAEFFKTRQQYYATLLGNDICRAPAS